MSHEKAQKAQNEFQLTGSNDLPYVLFVPFCG
jgi:hypothetical protein